MDNQSNNSWNIKQTFSKNRNLNNNQLGIVYEAMKNGDENIPLFKLNTDDTQINSAELTHYGFNTYSRELMTFYTNRFIPNGDETVLVDFMSKVFDYMNEGNILLINNQYKAKIFGKIEENKTTSSTDAIFTDIKYVLTKIKSPVPYSHVSDKKDYERFYDLANYAPMLAYKVKHANCARYCCGGGGKSSSGVKYTSPTITINFKPVLIPKDLQRKFNKPRKHFEEIRNLLKLNEETGFYSFTVENVNIPILCKHEYLIYEGKPMSEISLECYSDGKCKYCGQEIMAYHEQVKEILPPRVYDLIYKYMGTISENVDESGLMNSLFSLIYDSIKANVDTSDVKNYDASVVAFTALYLYVVYVKTKGGINYNVKISKFIDSAKKYWTEIGWTNDVVEQATKNSAMFSNMSNITEIIREKIYTNDILFLDVLPASIMFMRSVHPKEYDKVEAKTEIQKLWKSNKMIQYNKLFDKKISESWKFTHMNEAVEEMGKRKVEVSFGVVNIKPQALKNGEKFFTTCCEHYCPVANVHSWGGGSGGVCKHCGLKKDLSNKKDIYSKYETIINNSYLQKPCVLDDDKFKIDKLYSKSQIEKYKAEDLFEKFLVVDNHVLKQSIDKAINEKLHMDEIIKLISVITTLEEKELDKTPEFIKKALCFIIDNHIKEANEMMNELKNIYFKINSMNWLMMIR